MLTGWIQVLATWIKHASNAENHHKSPAHISLESHPQPPRTLKNGSDQPPIRIWTFFGLKKHFTSSHTLTIRELKSHTGVKKGPNCVLIKKMGSTEKQTKRWQNRISWTRDLFWVSTCWNFSSLEPSCQGLSLPLWKKKDKLQSKSIWHKKAQEANKLSKTFFQKLFHHFF